MSAKLGFLVLLAFVCFLVNAEPTLVTIRGRLTRSRTTTRVYATMLVQITSDITDLPATTTLDGDQQRDGEDSGNEDQPATVLGEVGEEKFTGRAKRTRSAEMITEATGPIPQSLIDEFIFTTKAVKAQQKSLAQGIAISGPIFVSLLLVFMLF